MDGLYICEKSAFQINICLSSAPRLALSIQGFQPKLRPFSTHYALSAIPCAAGDRTTLRSVLSESLPLLSDGFGVPHHNENLSRTISTGSPATKGPALGPLFLPSRTV